jgi:hypothetical protein
VGEEATAVNAGESDRAELVRLFVESLVNVDPGKRREALEEFSRRVPINVLDHIVHGKYRYEFIGSEPSTFGEYVATYPTGGGGVEGMHLIYLSPALEGMEPPEAVLSIVVHEIAHVWLQHGQPGHPSDDRLTNREADNQAHEWGFGKEIEARKRFANDTIIDFQKWVTRTR